MFLRFFKSISLKKIVKKSLSEEYIPSENKIKTVGLLIDGTRFTKIKELIGEFANNGIKSDNIKVLVYNPKKRKNNDFVYFGLRDIKLSKKTKGIASGVRAFENEPFDLLVNYYNRKHTALNYINVKSKADFKVGFSGAEKQLSHLAIGLPLSDYKLFVEELFKYLKLFNKI